jgi:predicted ATPase
MILTPDQRLRVFVSSTLEELGEERKAVTRAVESLRLTPVLFELGARPHAPSSLYRAYLAQSHVFVGVYWQRYGWVAPEMDVSGLEDEYHLSSGIPRLVYVKQPAPDREPELDQLIGRIEAEGEVSYRRFSTAAELEQIVKDDLVTLLSERFMAREPLPVRAPVPTPAAPLVGRDRELEKLGDLLVRGRARLVTLTGPGGVGKSRLAIEAARELAPRFPGGAFFVPLEHVDEPDAVPAAISRALGVALTPAESELDAIRDLFTNGDALLYLDNFEQVAEAAAFVADLLSATDGLTVLVTSREALRVRGEQELSVGPLAEDDAVHLFRDRAQAIGGDSENAALIAEICRRLDALPLAIELAAARTKLLALPDLLARLSDRLDIVGGKRGDLPERHQTLRSAIAWSYDLLGAEEQRLFARLGVFPGRFTLQAVEAVCARTPGDVLDGLSSLIDKSLVRAAFERADPAFTMLETIGSFAVEQLDASDFAAEAKGDHARYFVLRAVEARDALRDARQAETHEQLAADAENLAAAFRWWLDHEDVETLAEAVASLWVFWWLDGYLDEGRALVESILDRRDELSPRGLGRASSARAAVAFLQGDYTQALADATAALEAFAGAEDEPEAGYCLAILGIVHVFATDGARGEEELREAVRMLESAGDRWGAVRIKNALHWALLLNDKWLDSDEEYRSALAEAEDLASPQEVSMAAANLGRYHVFRGVAADGLPDLLAALEPMAQMRHKGAMAAILESLAEAALGLGDAERGVRLLAAAGALRESIGAPPAPAAARRSEQCSERLREALGEERFDREWSTGAALPLDEVLDDARALAGTSARAAPNA